MAWLSDRRPDWSRGELLPVVVTDVASDTMKRVKKHEILFFAVALVAACGGSPSRSESAKEQAVAPQHDASDPHSFTIQHQDTVVGVFTDIGIGCREVATQFSRCHAAFLESNYDEKMLREGHYPYYLKRRISGGSGHLLPGV